MGFLAFLAGSIRDPKTRAASSNKMQVWGVFVVLSIMILRSPLNDLNMELVYLYVGAFVFHSIISRGIAATDKPPKDSAPPEQKTQM